MTNREETEKEFDEEIEEEFAEDCDNCNKPGEVIECPSSSEEIKPGVTYHSRFCQECCASIFELEGCHDDVEECSRADMLFGKQLDTFARQHGLQKSPEHDHLYFDKTKVYCLSTLHMSPESLFKERQPPLEGFQFFAGKDHILFRTDERLSAYRIKVVDEVEKMFDELHLFGSRYLLLANSGILVVDRYPAWAAIAPIIGEGDTMTTLLTQEKQAFIDRTVEGAAFFRIQPQEDDLMITRPSRLVIDWSRINETKFQELCRDLLMALPGVKEARITGGQGDWGQDIEMRESIRTLTGENERRWAVQCKHIRSRSLARSDLGISPFEASLKFDYDVYCVMTSGQVSPGCYELLDMMERKLKIKCEVFDGKRLEDLLKARPEIYAAHFR